MHGYMKITNSAPPLIAIYKKTITKLGKQRIINYMKSLKANPSKFKIQI